MRRMGFDLRGAARLQAEHVLAAAALAQAVKEVLEHPRRAGQAAVG